jgi:hypothetical protein
MLSCLLVALSKSSADAGERPSRNPGKGVGAGGGPSLRSAFQDSISAAKWMLEHGLGTGWRDEKCDSEALDWFEHKQQYLLRFIETRPLVWVDYFESQSAGAAVDQCIEVQPNQLLARYRPCREIVSDHISAGKEILTQILKVEDFGLTDDRLKKQVMECFGIEVDSYILPFTPGLDAGRWIDYTDPNNNGEWQGYSNDHPRMSKDPKLSIPADLEYVRSVTVAVLKKIDQIELPNDYDRSIYQWLSTKIGDQTRAQLMADDIARTRFIVTDVENDQTTCARTSFEPNADVRFVIGRCERDFSSTIRVVQTVVHESTHHAPLAVEDEVLADAIGDFVAGVVNMRASDFHDFGNSPEVETLATNIKLEYFEADKASKAE